MLLTNKAFEDYRSRLDTVLHENSSQAMISCLMETGAVQDIFCDSVLGYIREGTEIKHAYDLEDGDRVLLMTENNCDMLVGFVVLSYLHLTVVLADPAMEENLLAELTQKCEIRAAFIDGGSLRRMDSNQNIPVFDTWKTESNLSVLRDCPAAHRDAPTPNTMAIIFSSGTTARMKPVEISYDAIIYAFEQNARTFGINRKNAKHPGYSVFPMTHISGLCVSVTAILYGQRLAMAQKLNAGTLKKGFEMFGPAQFAMVPKVYELLADEMFKELEKRKLTKLFHILRGISAFFRKKLRLVWPGRLCMRPFRTAIFGKNMILLGCGGAPCKWETAELMRDLGLEFVNVYSSTECAFYISTTGEEKSCPAGTVGKADSNAFGHIKILNPDASGTGEICVKTRFIMNGYYGNPDLTRSAFTEDGYFRTGDNGYIDDKGYLYVTGRQKEVILLRSGKKISPYDLADIFRGVAGGNAFAFAGVPVRDGGEDMIHMFVEKGTLTAGERSALEKNVYAWQRLHAPLYPIAKIHFIDMLPLTRIGKVKTYLLREMANKDNGGRETVPDAVSTEENLTVPDSDNAVLAEVMRIVRKQVDKEMTFSRTDSLKDDLGIDSLGIMAISVDIEQRFGVTVSAYMDLLQCAQEIADYINDPIFAEHLEKQIKISHPFSVADYPRKRRLVHRASYVLLKLGFRLLYSFQVSGAEKLRRDGRYIFCPNHETHLDGLWTWTALGKKAPALDRIACLGKQELLEGRLSSFFFTILGGIPTDRYGNPAVSVIRGIRFINEGNSFLVHPEGTRTRDGRLGPFKTGAAVISLQTGVPIVPVVIKGGFEIFPSNVKWPRIRSENNRRPVLEFVFCEPIFPQGKTADEITELLRQTISNQLETPHESTAIHTFYSQN